MPRRRVWNVLSTRHGRVALLKENLFNLLARLNNYCDRSTSNV